MLSRFLRFAVLLLLPMLAATYCVQAQDRSSEAPNPWITEPCDNRSDGEIFFQPPYEAGRLSHGLIDLIDGFGKMLLFLWWLFAVGLLGLVIGLLKKSVVVWVLMWLPLLLVGWVALPPLQELQQELLWLQQFQAQCRAYDPPSRALLAYKQRRWNDAFPYISMGVAMTLSYIPAIGHVVKHQRHRPLP